jgi:queuine/archaeosine tRNA-ribosyltransferase
MRLLVITSCTGEKAVETDRQLLLKDFEQGAKHIVAREKELADLCRKAGEMYTGEQHVRLMRGVSAFRSSPATCDSSLALHVLSAGYGIIPEDRVIAPYEVTFATMKAKEIDAWSKTLGVPEDFRRLVSQPYDLGLILLGDNYLRACQLDKTVKFGGPTILFCGTGMAKKLPPLANVQVIPISNPEAKRFSCGLVGLKGDLANRLLTAVAGDTSIVGKMGSKGADVLKLLANVEVRPSASSDASRGKQVSSINGSATAASPNPKVDWVIQLPKSWSDKPHRKKLRYFIPEWDDLVDPDYDFLTDTHSGENCNWEHAVYAHQMYPEPNYDGLLMSRAVAEAKKLKERRINELGVHRYLRVPREFPVMGDCGAFDYILEEKPPYSTADVIDYYTRLDFDYGVSVDHLIVTATEHQKKERYDLTIQNADDFLKEHRKARLQWEPIGAVQGWDPDSYAKAAAEYVKMGYRYIGLGGLVRSQTKEIVSILRRVREKVPSVADIHLFGLGRLNAIRDMAALGVTSVDSASPLRRAWLGGKDNYWTPDGEHYRAIRVPEAGKSFRAKRMVSEGRADSDFVQKAEKRLMQLLRSYDQGRETIENVLEALAEYDHLITPDRPSELSEYRRTLEARPWKKCSCEICKEDGVEVVIFRGNNRNRRRGFHNVYVFYRMMQAILNGTMQPPMRARGAHAYHPELALSA